MKNSINGYLYLAIAMISLFIFVFLFETQKTPFVWFWLLSSIIHFNLVSIEISKSYINKR